MALDNEKLTERPALTNSQDTDLIHVVRGNFSYQKEAQNFRAGSLGNINDIEDVNAPSPQTNNFLKWDTATSKWIANAIQLGDLLDVVIDDNTLANGQVITYDSGNEEWINTTIPTASVGGADTQVQYNDSGSFGAGAFFTTDKSSKIEVTNEIGILGDGATEQGILKLYCENGNAHYVGIKGGNHAGGSTYELQMPNALPNVTNQILESNANGELSWINTPSAGIDEFIDLTDTPATYSCQSGKNVKVDYSNNAQELIFTPDYMDFACSDEDTDLATGRVFTMIANRIYPHISAVEFSVTGAPTGANLEFDVQVNGTSIYLTTPSIDAGEKLTATASTQQILAANNIGLTIGDELRVLITQVGSTNAGAGLKATMVYNDRICI